MRITSQQLIALLPILIIGLTIIIIMLSIAWRRNHFLNAIFSVVGLNSALISLWFVSNTGSIDITPLIHVDNYTILYSGLGLLSSIATCTFAYSWLTKFHNYKEEFYLLVLIASIGGIVLSNANHLVSLFFGIELISLPLCGLIGYSTYEKNSLEASIKYTVLSAAASSFLLLGIALSYAQSSDLSFISFGKIFDNKILHEPLLSISLGLMIVGLGFKLSLVPFHLWTPDVYQSAPSPTTTFLITMTKIVVLCAMIRLFLYIPTNNHKVIILVINVIAFISIIFGSLMALNQTNIKRLLGYSSISHIGYLLVALIADRNLQISIEAVNIYLINYLFSNLGIFSIISFLSELDCSSNSDSLLFYRGLFWNHPVMSIVMTIMIFSLAGIPMTLGFISKFYILTLIIQGKLWWLLIAIVISSAVSLYYYLKVILNLYLSVPKKLYHGKLHNFKYSANRVIMLVSTLFVLVFGIYPQPIINIAQRAIPIL